MREKNAVPHPGGTYNSDDWMKSQSLVGRLKGTKHKDRKKTRVVW